MGGRLKGRWGQGLRTLHSEHPATGCWLRKSLSAHGSGSQTFRAQNPFISNLIEHAKELLFKWTVIANIYGIKLQNGEHSEVFMNSLNQNSSPLYVTM